ncbi:MAG: glycosyltransferase family 2 protein [Nitrospira sp.]|nr:glycosyltransferase family 2 protein [Nitrospira sp.]
MNVIPRILLAIPCYNEGANISKILQEIKEQETDCDIIVVDDGSSDNTYFVASQFSHCVKLVANLGIGGAVQTALKYALENDYDLFIRIDGDGQHPPSQIHVLIKSYLTSSANLIIGSRFLLIGDFQSTWTRRLGIGVIRSAFKWLFGRKITDLTSGFMLMDRKAIRLFSAEYPQDFPEPISTAFALERGLTVREVPVQMRAREQGSSSIRGIKIFAYMVRVIGYLILIRMGRHI